MSSANVTIKMAQSASALGAGLLGFAIGGKWGYVINNTILVITLSVGAVPTCIWDVYNTDEERK